MKGRKVAIIFNDDGYDRYSYGKREIKIDNNTPTAKEMSDCLTEKGFEVMVLPLRVEDAFDLTDFMRRLRSEKADVVFNLCEGAFERSEYEMHVASLLELHGVRFTGSGPLTLGLALDKGLSKDILNSRDIMTPEYCVLKEPPARLKRSLRFPLIVKPLREDASVGIDANAVVRTMKELKARVEYIIGTYCQPAIVEEYVDGREFNVAVTGNWKGKRAMPVSEISFEDFPPDRPRIICYEAKWIKASPLYKKTKPVCPAEIPESLAGELREIALKAYDVMGCRDYARVDMRLGEDGNVKVLEVNPNPDISSDAGLANAARAAGLSYGDLLELIVNSALARYQAEEEGVPQGAATSA